MLLEFVDFEPRHPSPLVAGKGGELKQVDAVGLNAEGGTLLRSLPKRIELSLRPVVADHKRWGGLVEPVVLLAWLAEERGLVDRLQPEGTARRSLGQHDRLDVSGRLVAG